MMKVFVNIITNPTTSTSDSEDLKDLLTFLYSYSGKTLRVLRKFMCQALLRDSSFKGVIRV